MAGVWSGTADWADGEDKVLQIMELELASSGNLNPSSRLTNAPEEIYGIAAKPMRHVLVEKGKVRHKRRTLPRYERSSRQSLSPVSVG